VSCHRPDAGGSQNETREEKENCQAQEMKIIREAYKPVILNKHLLSA